MFHRDAQPLVITILRGTCVHGDIVIHISLAHTQHKFQRGFQKVTMIVHIIWHLLITLFITCLINLWLFSKHNTWYLIALRFAWRFLLLLDFVTKSSLFKKWFEKRFFWKLIQFLFNLFILFGALHKNALFLQDFWGKTDRRGWTTICIHFYKKVCF